MILHGFQGQQVSFPLRYFQSQERLLNWYQVFCGIIELMSPRVSFEGTYIPALRSHIYSSRTDGGLETLDTLVFVVPQPIKNFNNASSVPKRTTQALCNFSSRLARKANKRLHVFGLREHIIRLNSAYFVIARQGFPFAHGRIRRVFDQFSVFIFDQAAA